MSNLRKIFSSLQWRPKEPITKSDFLSFLNPQSNILPRQLAIEPVCGCNAGCMMCPVGYLTRKKGVLSSENHRTILNKVANWGAPIETITHAGLGEPLLDKNLETKITYEKSIFPDASVIVYSNASLLTKQRATSLIASGLDIISFSINGYYQQTYEKVMKLSREIVYNNVLGFLEVNSKMGNPVKVHISLIKTAMCSEEEIKVYFDYWGSRVDAVVTPPWISWGGQFENDNYCDDQWPCFYIWHVLMIDYDGTVKMCCEDFDSKFPIGNIITESPDIIYNSERMKRQRKRQIEGDFCTPSICLNCTETYETARDYWKACLPKIDT